MREVHSCKEDVLDQRAFVATARSAKPGQQARITFKGDRNGINTLGRLSRAYCGHNGVEVSETDKVIALAVLSSMDWGGDKNRTIGFTNIQNLDENALYQFGRDIDKITLVQAA